MSSGLMNYEPEDCNVYDLNEKPLTSFMLGLPDTIEKVTIKMGGRTVEFDVNTFMDMLESFK
jgi:hypothetical protein